MAAFAPLNAANPKILSFKKHRDFLEIRLNQPLSEGEVKKHGTNGGIYYDIAAELTTKKQKFSLAESEIVVAQNTKENVRIVVFTPHAQGVNLKARGEILVVNLAADSPKDSAKDSRQDSPKSAAGAQDSPKNPAKDSQDSREKSQKDSPSKIANLFNYAETKDENIDLSWLEGGAAGDSPKDSRQDSPKDSQNAAARDLAQDSGRNSPDSPPKNPKNPAKALPKDFAKNKIVVIDPGHGGKDCGAQVSGVCEKTITFNIALEVKKILKNRGYTVHLTREKDSYIALDERTRFANDKNSDVFVSIHANALDKKSKNYRSASGIESYFLSVARSERARKVAEAENRDNIEVMDYFSKLSFLNSINSQRLLASNKLAIDVQAQMLFSARKKHRETIDGGVREGPFWVLAGALMPSVLVEVGYMTNAAELSRLTNAAYQGALAHGIADGIEGFFAKNY